jgi:hypothetical protein
LGARVRAIKSVEPPGGNGTMMVTGLSGQAHAVDRHRLVNNVARNLFMVFSNMSSEIMYKLLTRVNL